jgi:hypothetical protein
MLIDIQGYLLFGKKFESDSSKVSTFPIRMALELASLGFSSQHDYHTHILLPDNRPKVLEGGGEGTLCSNILLVTSRCFQMTGIDIIT